MSDCSGWGQTRGSQLWPVHQLCYNIEKGPQNMDKVSVCLRDLYNLTKCVGHLNSGIKSHRIKYKDICQQPWKHRFWNVRISNHGSIIYR